MTKNEPFVIHKDKNFLAVFKPAGLLIHPVLKANPKEPTLVDFLLKNYPEVKKVGDEPETRPGIVHRLDKDVSGVVLVARNQKYFEYLKNLFQTRKMKKKYLALVYGQIKPEKGIIEKPISIKSGSIKRTVWKGKGEKEAITEYRVLKAIKYPVSNIRKDAFSLVEVSPKTGRTHQIRIHLASIGHPIVGDTLYGHKQNPFGMKRIFLHAESLEFSPAEGKRIKIESELPKELKDLLKVEN